VLSDASGKGLELQREPADNMFSVITVCLNASAHLKEALQSIVSQNYGNLESIVVDGGSTDGTVEIIREMAWQDRRIVWCSEPDYGIADAMNKGLAIAKGDFVAFLHADDSYASQNIISLVAEAFDANPQHFWVSGGINEIDIGGRIFQSIGVRSFSRRRLLRNNIILHPATFVRRSALQRLGGFNPSLHYAMDYDLWLRLALLGPPVELNHILTNFRVHSGSISSANREATLREEYLVRKHYLRGPISRIGHALYHLWRVLNISYCSRFGDSFYAPNR
jgi:glycosyltransferase involved in cell wall biosynthesis